MMFKGDNREKVRGSQLTAINDAPCVRALKIYEKHTQASAIDFVDQIIDEIPISHM